MFWERQNDYNDIHQLLYVNDFTQDVVISEDRGVMWQMGISEGKVLSFRDFLNREAPQVAPL